MAAVVSTPTGQQSPAVGGRVVVGIDDSPAGLAALRWAIGLPGRGARGWSRSGRGRSGCRGTAGSAATAAAPPVVIAFHGAEPGQAALRLTKRAFRETAPDALGDVEVTIEMPRPGW